MWGVEVGCIISAGSWIFVGLVNVVKVWKTLTHNDIILGGPVGQVHSLATTGLHPLEISGELLFTGQQLNLTISGHYFRTLAIVLAKSPVIEAAYADPDHQSLISSKLRVLALFQTPTVHMIDSAEKSPRVARVVH
ncbi:hypothetical protein ACLOJK_027825 [Asimina triloba]